MYDIKRFNILLCYLHYFKALHDQKRNSLMNNSIKGLNHQRWVDWNHMDASLSLFHAASTGNLVNLHVVIMLPAIFIGSADIFSINLDYWVFSACTVFCLFTSIWTVRNFSMQTTHYGVENAVFNRQLNCVTTTHLWWLGAISAFTLLNNPMQFRNVSVSTKWQVKRVWIRRSQSVE